MTRKVTIAIVEDEDALVTLLRYNLAAEGYDVQAYQDGEQAEYELRDTVPNLLILDWMLPNVSGFELCRRLRLRKNTKSLPIIMLTARGQEDERVRGLNVGADDFIVKPFSMAELLARVKALLRRAQPDALAERLEVSGIMLDRLQHRVFHGSTELYLGPTEFKLLDFFMSAPGRVFSRAQLLDGVWGCDNFVDDRTVDVHIRRLRLVINKTENDLIRTVRGAGYAFG